MGNTHTTVDAVALTAAADRFDDVAALLERAARTSLSFDGMTAGRSYGAQGGQLRRALEIPLAELDGWARASAEIAGALRIAARRYRDADQAVAGGLGR